MSTSIAQNDITFAEFITLCEEAGISTDNMAQMEQDFRAGKALADVTDVLITSAEEHPEPYTFEQHESAMDEAVLALDPDRPAVENKGLALKVAVHALRFIAECCHDEGSN